MASMSSNPAGEDAPSDVMVWADLLDRCSRLHTERRRPSWPNGPMREAAAMTEVTVGGRPAVVIPTRMHEPGFYWRYEDVGGADGIMRSDDDIDLLRKLVEDGKVSWRP